MRSLSFLLNRIKGVIGTGTGYTS